MIGEEIKLRAEDSEVYDKKEIALAIRNGNYEDEIVCSLLDEQIIKSCASCSLRNICDGIDKVSEGLKDRTTTLVKSFQFE
jgi:hypothetical protein